MKKIDTSDWRKFIIGNLFEPLETGFIGVGKKLELQQLLQIVYMWFH